MREKKGEGKTRTMNGWGENDQHVLFPEGQMKMRAMAPDYRCFSRFRAAADYVAERYAAFVGGGDKQNILEDALATAYEKGWKDAKAET